MADGTAYHRTVAKSKRTKAEETEARQERRQIERQAKGPSPRFRPPSGFAIDPLLTSSPGAAEAIKDRTTRGKSKQALVTELRAAGLLPLVPKQSADQWADLMSGKQVDTGLRMRAPTKAEARAFTDLQDLLSETTMTWLHNDGAVNEKRLLMVARAFEAAFGYRADDADWLDTARDLHMLITGALLRGQTWREFTRCDPGADILSRLPAWAQKAGPGVLDASQLGRGGGASVRKMSVDKAVLTAINMKRRAEKLQLLTPENLAAKLAK